MTKVPALILLLCLALAAPAVALEKPGAKLPDAALPGLDGKVVNLRSLAKDKVTVVVFWSVSCPHCRKEMPSLLALDRRLTGNPFVMILVNGDGPAMLPAVKAYVKDYRLPGPVLLDQGPDDSMPLGDALDIVATPTVMVFNRKGVLVQAQEVEVNQASLEKAVEAAF